MTRRVAVRYDHTDVIEATPEMGHDRGQCREIVVHVLDGEEVEPLHDMSHDGEGFR